MYTGTIIEESLGDKAILGKLKILSTKVSPVTEKDNTPWIKQWTLHQVEISDDQARGVAEELSKAIDQEHAQAWYADFKNETHHYIIFLDKVFYIDRTKPDQYEEAKQYGIKLGVPDYQIQFEKHVVPYKDVSFL